MARRRRELGDEAAGQASEAAEAAAEAAARLAGLGTPGGPPDLGYRPIPPHLASQRGGRIRHGRHYHYGGEDGLVFWPSAVERYHYSSAEEAWEDYASAVPDGGWEIVEDVPLRVTSSRRRASPSNVGRARRRRGWAELSPSYRERLVGAGRRRGMTRRQVYDLYRRGGPELEELYGHRGRRVERLVGETGEGPSSWTVWTAHEDGSGRKIESGGRPRPAEEDFEEWLESTGGYDPGEFRRGRLLWID